MSKNIPNVVRSIVSETNKSLVKLTNDNIKRISNLLDEKRATIKIQDQREKLKTKVSDIVVWYERATGLDEVRALQNRVIEAQSNFVKAQERRREASKELSAIQGKLKEIYAELDTTSRGDERYLHLITKEHSILKEERRLLSEFTQCEAEERDTFTFFSSSVKESHEKERAQAEKTKYWSVIGSIIGTIIGVLGSSVTNEYRMRELRKLVRDNNAIDPAFLAAHEKDLSQIVEEMKTIVKKESSQPQSYNLFLGEPISKLEKSLGQLSQQVVDLQENLKPHQNAVPGDLELVLNSYKQHTTKLLIGVTIASIVIPLLLFSIRS